MNCFQLEVHSSPASKPVLCHIEKIIVNEESEAVCQLEKNTLLNLVLAVIGTLFLTTGLYLILAHIGTLSALTSSVCLFGAGALSLCMAFVRQCGQKPRGNV